MARHHRSELGADFSEAARLLWLAVGTHDGAHAEATRRLRLSSGMITKYLYGDRRPGRETTERIRAEYGIDSPLWNQPPSEPFCPPAGAEAA